MATAPGCGFDRFELSGLGSPSSSTGALCVRPNNGRTEGSSRALAGRLPNFATRTAARSSKIGGSRRRRTEANDFGLCSPSPLRSNSWDASRALAAAKQLNPEKAGLWFAEAAIALRSERPDEAIDLLARGLQLDPDNPAAYFDLGNARIMRDELKLALTAFERATSLKPDFWEALNNQALVLYEIGNRNEAIKRWRRVLEIENNPEPMLALAAALHQRGTNREEALSLATTALSQDPNYVLTPHQVEQLWGARIRQAAAQLLDEEELADTVERAQANATWKKNR